ncbi:MAG: sulfatase-like hydrolase/transferase [Bacteroidia bacterium]|nr:sulfatase-like hydrolase/transferase [Bacteroidia bacterium]
MKKYLLYQTIFCLAGTSVLLPSRVYGKEKTEPKKDAKLPNVVVILADDHGFYTASDSRQCLPAGEILLPELLKKKGCTTGIFGKWHLGLERPYYRTSRGFDTFYGFSGDVSAIIANKPDIDLSLGTFIFDCVEL